MEKKYWKSQGILSARKSGNPAYITHPPPSILPMQEQRFSVSIISEHKAKSGHKVCKWCKHESSSVLPTTHRRVQWDEHARTIF